MIFDIKMEDFRHNSRLVTGDHMTKATTVIMYASVRWREIGMKALMIAAINYLEVKSADIHYMHT